MDSSTQSPLKVLIFPLNIPGHLIPTLDLAKLFSSHGLHVAIITTPSDSHLIQSQLSDHHAINHHHLDVTDAEAPDPTTLTTDHSVVGFLKAYSLFQQPFEHLLSTHLPDFVVSDVFLTWTADSTAKFNIPRLVFSGSGVFSKCATHCVRRFSPYNNATSDTDPFLLPGLPHRIEMTRAQLPDFAMGQGPFSDIMAQIKEAGHRTYGEVINSFCELEADYVEYYKKEICSKVWTVGPLSLCNRVMGQQAQRGKQASIDPHKCLGWLDSKEPDSVLYVCFGSMCHLNEAQLMEIACALEGYGGPFIWVVRNADKLREEWVPEGFEERTKERGLIIKGWAPQVMILNHRALGGFVTHCGWNSILEGVSAGVPLVTWPLYAEQFYNEKLITRVLRVGVEVGATVWCASRGEEMESSLIGREQIVKAVAQLMDGGDEADEMRRRAKELGEKAKRALMEDGSSSKNLTELIKDINMYHHRSN